MPDETPTILFTHKDVGIYINQYGNFEAKIGDNEKICEDTLRGVKDKIDKEFEARVQAAKVTVSLRAIALVTPEYRNKPSEVRGVTITGLHRVQSTYTTSPATKDAIEYALPASPANAALLKHFDKVRTLYRQLEKEVKERDIKPKNAYGRISSEDYPGKVAVMETRYKTVAALPSVELTALDLD